MVCSCVQMEDLGIGAVRFYVCGYVGLLADLFWDMPPKQVSFEPQLLGFEVWRVYLLSAPPGLNTVLKAKD